MRAAKEIRLFGLGNLLRARMVDSLTAVSGARLAVARRGTLAQGALAVVGGTGTVGVGSGRAAVGYLVLFLGTVAGVQDMAYDLTAAENIGIGQVRAFGERDRLTRAAIAARVDDVVAALSDGCDTLLSRTHTDGGRAGVALSGGSGSGSRSCGA
ncbi:hypothetical protein [Actinosynnema pretiosum]|uniref:Uncharacterized protein n=1 Tax=Actinosynnema pretiosum TaxID=42197 RepID=A0A290Z3N9_9PSEU|nr:hypothetical protein [Actinosynnema pretiosum]ATE53646.1 hypothetical protein CNX65_10390 [Actinosynnema pretiosum]